MTYPKRALLLLGLGACELSPKNLSDTGEVSSDADTSGGETGADSGTTTGPNTTQTGGDQTGGVETGGQSTGGGTTGGSLQCEDPLQFPGVGKECAGDNDCAVVFHQVDCCGSLVAIGVDAGTVDAFNEAEAMCAAKWPACECAQKPTAAEDGESTEDQAQIVAACEGGLCQSQVPDAGPLQWFTTCGDPVCSGYTKPDGVPPCTAEQMEGNPCDVEGTTCDPVSDCNALLVCASKDPKQNPGGCPISRAKFKTDIEYLGPADLERYAADLSSLRLATYRYRAAPTSAPPRLGIVLEDNEHGVWVDAAHDRVDLYGYASLAVAALQVQQRQIAELRAEVDRLSAQLEGAAVCAP